MVKGETYLGIVVVLFLAVVLVFAGSLNDKLELTGKAVDDFRDENTTIIEDESIEDEINETEIIEDESIEDEINETEIIEDEINETTEDVVNNTLETTNETEIIEDEINETTEEVLEEEEEENEVVETVAEEEEENEVVETVAEEVEEEEIINTITPGTETVDEQAARLIKELEEEQAALLVNETENKTLEVESEPDKGITGGVVADEEEAECFGCLLKNKCYEINDTKKDMYCLEDKTWVNQSEFMEVCAYDFECESNNCIDEQCAKFDILKEIVELFKELFQTEQQVVENVS